MNVYLVTDLEGIAGVDSIEFMDRNGESYQKAREMLTRSIAVAVKTCFACGANKVWYLDGHGGGGNVYPEKMDARAEKSTIAQWMELLAAGEIDCEIELGSHARAGTVGGFLDHTLNSTKWFSLKVNGVEMSELSMHALIAAKYGVPTVACIGDEVATVQAKEYIPDLYTGAVKKAECRNVAVTDENAEAILVQTIQEALANYKQVSLYRLPEPLTVELTLNRTDYCEELIPKITGKFERVDARTLRKTVSELKSYYDLRF